MKKGDQTPKRKAVLYKGEMFKLPPGHQVYQIDFDTDPFIVKESKLKRVFTWKNVLFFWKNEPLWTPADQRENILHRPAKDLYTAKVLFKNATSKLKNKDGKIVKIKGL